MGQKITGIFRLIFARDYVLMTDSAIIGRTTNSDNGKYIKKFVEATLEAKKGEVSGG